MTAVIRIKRPLTEDPIETILLKCKKQKTESYDQENISTVLKLAGTVPDAEQDVFKHMKKSSKVDAEQQYKKHTTSLSQKLRQENQSSSKDNRYKVVNSFRSSETDSIEANSASNISDCTIVDIESSNSEEKAETEKPDCSDQKYVYDLYYTNSDDLGDADLNEFISVYPLSDTVFGRKQDETTHNDDDSEYDSEDSNAENNWKNDYPDESDMEYFDRESVTEEDMLQSMKRIDLDLDLSSEDDISSNEHFLDNENENYTYCQFKERIQQQIGEDFSYYDDYDNSCTP